MTKSTNPLLLVRLPKLTHLRHTIDAIYEARVVGQGAMPAPSVGYQGCHHIRTNSTRVSTLMTHRSGSADARNSGNQPQHAHPALPRCCQIPRGPLHLLLMFPDKRKRRIHLLVASWIPASPLLLSAHGWQSSKPSNGA